jgi:hypothetical protein
MKELKRVKKVIKELTYKVLFGRNKIVRLIKYLFHCSRQYIISLNYIRKKKDYRVLAYMTYRGVKPYIQYYNKKIMNIYPEIKIITVHDSIVFLVNIEML